MNPKKLIVPVLCVLLGCAGGAAMGSVTAQTWPEPASVQRWQQECVTGRPVVGDRANAVLRERGAQGWRAFSADLGGAWVCFERPVP